MPQCYALLLVVKQLINIKWILAARIRTKFWIHIFSNSKIDIIVKTIKLKYQKKMVKYDKEENLKEYR